MVSSPNNFSEYIESRSPTESAISELCSTVQFMVRTTSRLPAFSETNTSARSEINTSRLPAFSETNATRIPPFSNTVLSQTTSSDSLPLAAVSINTSACSEINTSRLPAFSETNATRIPPFSNTVLSQTTSSDSLPLAAVSSRLAIVQPTPRVSDNFSYPMVHLHLNQESPVFDADNDSHDEDDDGSEINLHIDTDTNSLDNTSSSDDDDDDDNDADTPNDGNNDDDDDVSNVDMVDNIDNDIISDDDDDVDGSVSTLHRFEISTQHAQQQQQQILQEQQHQQQLQQVPNQVQEQQPCQCSLRCDYTPHPGTSLNDSHHHHNSDESMSQQQLQRNNYNSSTVGSENGANVYNNIANNSSNYQLLTRDQSESRIEDMMQTILGCVESRYGDIGYDEFMDCLHRVKQKIVERYEANDIFVFGISCSAEASCCYLKDYTRKLTCPQFDFINLVCDIQYKTSRRKLNRCLRFAYGGPADRAYFNSLVTRRSSGIAEASIVELQLAELDDLEVNRSTCEIFEQYRDQFDVRELHRANHHSTLLTLRDIQDRCNNFATLAATRTEQTTSASAPFSSASGYTSQPLWTLTPPLSASSTSLNL